MAKIRTGKTGDEGKPGKVWPYYFQLMFLKKCAEQRPSFSSVLVCKLSLVISRPTEDVHIKNL